MAQIEPEGRHEVGGWKVEFVANREFDALIHGEILKIDTVTVEVPGEPLRVYEQRSMEIANFSIDGMDVRFPGQETPRYTEDLNAAYAALQHLIAAQHVNVEMERDFFNDWEVRIEPGYDAAIDAKGYAFHPDLAAAISGAMVSWIKNQEEWTR